jgi:hypothetical protein
VVNSSQGGGSKDTWVLASRTSGADRELGAAEVVKKLPKAATSSNGEADSEKSQSQNQKQFQQQRQTKSEPVTEQQPGQQQQLQQQVVIR